MLWREEVRSRVTLLLATLGFDLSAHGSRQMTHILKAV